MLTKKQEIKLNLMVENYYKSVLRTCKVTKDTAKRWSNRYRIAVEHKLPKC
jgi:hypothetical protein